KLPAAGTNVTPAPHNADPFASSFCAFSTPLSVHATTIAPSLVAVTRGELAVEPLPETAMPGSPQANTPSGDTRLTLMRTGSAPACVRNASTAYPEASTSSP